MSKSLLTLLAMLPLLFAALVFGRQAPPRSYEPHVASAAHARAAAHASSHDRTSIDDDDEYDDADDVEVAMLAPPADGVDDLAADGASEGPSTCTARPAFATTGASLRMTGRGIRPAGEHRSTTDRPPRA
jgi:hypothetical protein